jgi:hypothetical protein
MGSLYCRRPSVGAATRISPASCARSWPKRLALVASCGGRVVDVFDLPAHIPGELQPPDAVARAYCPSPRVWYQDHHDRWRT